MGLEDEGDCRLPNAGHLSTHHERIHHDISIAKQKLHFHQMQTETLEELLLSAEHSKGYTCTVIPTFLHRWSDSAPLSAPITYPTQRAHASAEDDQRTSRKDAVTAGLAAQSSPARCDRKVHIMSKST